MNYNGYITAIGDLLQYTVTDATSATPFANTDINNILPSMIQYAELRIYREFDFLSTVITKTALCTTGIRNVTVPAELIVLQSANVITPYTTTNPDLGVRNKLDRTSIEFINYTWPDPSVTELPTLYALNQANLTTGALPNICVAPTPNHNYTIECLGTARPAPLSSTNTSTFLTLNIADLFISASMVFGSGFQQNYGAQSENPQLGTSWEGQYQLQKAGIMVEELRKKAQSTDWQPYLPSALAPRQ